MTSKQRMARKTYEAAMAAAGAKYQRRIASVPAIRFGLAPLQYASYEPQAARAEYDQETAAARAVYDAAMRRT